MFTFVQNSGMALVINQSNCKFCKKKSFIFSSLNDDELEYINEERFEVHYSPGETILKQGTPVSHVISFTSGLAKVTIEGGENRNLILYLITPQDFIASPGVYYQNIHHFSVNALEPSSVCYIDWTRFSELLKSNDRFNAQFLAFMNQSHVRTLEKLINLYRKQVRGRVAEAIIYLADEIYKSNPFQLTLPVADIAALAGASKEATFKIIKECTDDGILTISKKQINILDRDHLKMISEKG